jgi:hypothetical protein
VIVARNLSTDCNGEILELNFAHLNLGFQAQYRIFEPLGLWSWSGMFLKEGKARLIQPRTKDRKSWEMEREARASTKRNCLYKRLVLLRGYGEGCFPQLCGGTPNREMHQMRKNVRQFFFVQTIVSFCGLTCMR